MNVFITGAAGFIGSHLVEYHLNKGDSVHGVDNLSTGTMENILSFLKNPNFRFDRADILFWQGLQQAVLKADRIYNMAAVVGVFKVLEDPVNVIKTNVSGCERLLRHSVKNPSNPPVIIASSSEVYGSQGLEELDCCSEDRPVVIKLDEGLRWNYVISKMADEALGMSYVHQFDRNVIIARLFNIIGPRQTGAYGMVVPRFISQALGGQPICVYGDGSQTRCFCDVRDVVVALDLLASNPASCGEIVNLGRNGSSVSIKELAFKIRDKCASISPVVFIPYEQAYGARFRDIQHRKPVIQKLLKLTDMKFKWSLETTLDDLVRRGMSGSF
jgi:UDP-glucose 4-epimerase